MDFVDLHSHSTYSCLDAFGTPKQIVERAKSLGREAIALTDHGSVSGHVQLNKACKEAEIKPIFGYEAYIVGSLPAMFEKKIRKKNHITLLAETDKGYLNILKLASKAFSEGFYYFPTIDWEMLFQHSEGVVAFSGCWSGILQQFLQSQELDGAKQLATKLRDVFQDRFFLETQHYELFKDTFPALVGISKELNIPLVLTCDTHFPTLENAHMQEILHAIRDRRTFEKERIIADAYQWPVQDLFQLVEKRFGSGSWEDIMKQSVAIAERCNVSLPSGAFIKFSANMGKDPDHELVRLCKEGVEKRGLKQAGQVYQQRFLREKKVISEKNFSDYLLVVADIVNWAKDRGILVGSGRGSAAGSLICYLLGITEIDPIKHDLLFERFIDETRTDLPDIDTDFESDRRDEVKAYAVSRFGEANVSDVATFAQFKGKNSLDEVGKVFSIPSPMINTVKKYLIDRSSGDMRSQLTIMDTFDMSPEAKAISQKFPEILNACSLEGQMRHMGTHAAGILVGDKPLDGVVAIYERDGRKLSSVEMKDASSLGLVKIDLLGVTELSILGRIAEVVGLSAEGLYKLPLDDKATLQAFKEMNVEGIFQFNGEGTKSVLRQMSYLDFEMVSACVALSKPGPSHSGSTAMFFKKMNGDRDAKGFDWHPVLERITSSTYGQIIYQEQIIKILREFANFSVTDANRCRTIIQKTIGEQEFDKFWPAFLEGAKGKIPGEKIKELWDSLKVYGHFCFNRSHAVSYGVLAYWSMYLKTHHPLQFYLYKLRYEADAGTKVRLLMDASRKGVKILPPLLGTSGAEWQIENGDSLRAGLTEAKGVGAKTAAKLVEEKYASREDFVNRKAKGITIRVLKALDEACAFPGDTPKEDYFGIHKYRKLDEILPDRVKLIDINNVGTSMVVGGVLVEMNYKDIFEERASRGKPSENLRSPEKAKYAMVMLEDGLDRCLIQIDRFLFAKCGDKVWDAFSNKKFVAIYGDRVPGWQMVRAKDFQVWEE